MTDVRRVVLIGGGGMLGKRLVKDLPHEVIVTSSRAGVGDYTLDLSDFNDAELKFIDVNDTVLMAAAVSSPDTCKRDPEYARAVNVVGTQRVITHCLSKGARVIFFSSDTVYGGTVNPVVESAQLFSVGAYAVMKAEIEKGFNEIEGFLALRISYVVSAQDKFTRYLSECTARNRNAEIFHPLTRNAVWIGDLVAAVALLIDKFPDNTQALNIGGPAPVSRVDMANAFSTIVDSNLSYEVVEPGTEFYAARPITITMNTKQLSKFIGREPCDLHAAYRNEFKLKE